MEMFNPSHPGRIVRIYIEDRTTVSALARRLGMTRANLSMILNGRLGISAAVAVKLSEAFPNTDARFWLTLQNNYDVAQVRRRRRRKIAPLYPPTPSHAKAA